MCACAHRERQLHMQEVKCGLTIRPDEARLEAKRAQKGQQVRGAATAHGETVHWKQHLLNSWPGVPREQYLMTRWPSSSCGVVKEWKVSRNASTNSGSVLERVSVFSCHDHMAGSAHQDTDFWPPGTPPCSLLACAEADLGRTLCTHGHRHS